MIASIPLEVTLLPDRVSIEETIEEDECPDCGGTGWFVVDRCYGNEHYQDEEECSLCHPAADGDD